MKILYRWVILIIVGIAIISLSIGLFTKKVVLENSTSYGYVVEIKLNEALIIMFKWPNMKFNNTALIEEVDHCSFKYRCDDVWSQKMVTKEIVHCIKQMSEHIDETSKHINDIIYIFTLFSNELHLLERFDRNDNRSLINKFKENLFHELDSIKIENMKTNVKYPIMLTSDQEIAYKWMTLNYVNKQLTSKGKPRFVALLNLNKLSSDLILPVTRNISNYEISVFNKEHTLYKSINDCFGTDALFKRYLLNKVLDDVYNNGSTQVFVDHCNNKNLNRTIFGKEFINDRCCEIKGEHSLIDIIGDYEYKFNGYFNERLCSDSIKSLFTDCDKMFSHCFHDVQTNVIDAYKYYIAIDRYFRVTRVLPTLSKHDSINHFTYFEETINYCKVDWKNLNETRLIHDCFDLNLIDNLMINQYKFSNEHFGKIKFIEAIKSINVNTATIGFILEESKTFANFIMSNRYLSLGNFLILIIIGGILIAVAILFIYQENQNQVRTPIGEYEIF